MTKERDKHRKASKRASETREQTSHRQEQNRTHLACAEVSALQCCPNAASGRWNYGRDLCHDDNEGDTPSLTSSH